MWEFQTESVESDRVIKFWITEKGSMLNNDAVIKLTLRTFGVILYEMPRKRKLMHFGVYWVSHTTRLSVSRENG